MRVVCLLVQSIVLVGGHAVMTKPIPRAGTQIGSGVKLSPYENAKTIADGGCGGPDNKDPGTTVPLATYQSGDQVQVEWKLTIPHPADNTRNGIRVALHVSAQDSFAQNVLAGGVVGDPQGYQIVPAGADGDQADALKTVTVNLPPGKTCNLCTLQWVWSAEGDGGSYVGCADISITNDGISHSTVITFIYQQQ